MAFFNPLNNGTTGKYPKISNVVQLYQ